MTDNLNNHQNNDEHNLGGTALTGAVLMIATRFIVRLLGLVSVTVLARLLTPEDFGLFGTAALILSFFLLLKEIGFSEAVIKEDIIEKEDLDTLWTMRLILSICISAMVFLISPFIADFLKDERVELVLKVMFILPIIDALASPASALLLRELKYGTDFLLKSGNKIVHVVAVITVAIILQSYWALVFGAILSALFNVVISHIVRPYRPKLSLQRLDQHIGFASWIYLRSFSSYFANSSDEFVVRSTMSTAFFGIYHISRDLARVLISDLIGPVREAMLPALIKMKKDPTRQAAAVANIFGSAIIIGIALSFGVAMTAPELVLVLLGEQWNAAAPYLSLLAIGCACNSIAEISQSSFVTAGHQMKSALFWTLRATVYGTGCITAGLLYGPIAVAITFTISSVAILAVETIYLFHIMSAKVNIISLTIRPLLSGGIMVLAIYLLPLPTTSPPLVILLLKAICGAVVYGVILLGLWKITGYKEGPEHTLYSNMPRKLQKLMPLQIS